MSNSASKIRAEAIAAIQRSATVRRLMLGTTSTNLLLFPETLENAAWANSGSLNVVPNAARDGSGALTLERLEDYNSADVEGVAQDGTPSPAGTFTLSCDIAAGTLVSRIQMRQKFVIAGAFFDTVNGLAFADAVSPATSYAMTSLGGGVYRCSVTYTFTATTTITATLQPCAAALGGPYTLTNNLLGYAMFGRVLLVAGTSSVYPDLVTPSRVFDGIEGYRGPRNRGRLPFFEVEESSQSFGQESVEGGTETTVLEVKLHFRANTSAGGRDTMGDALAAAVAAIRAAPDRGTGAGGYFNAGSDRIGPLIETPLGFSRSAFLTVEHTFDRTNYGQT